LRPLSSSESAKLAEALGAEQDSRERIIEAAEGNPLFVEQMTAMLVEDGELDAMPATIQALLAARLDRLAGIERGVIECAAVAGKEFWRDAVVALCSEEARQQISSILMSLVRKELIRPERSSSRPDDAFRFAHVLIRDAAYAGIPRETRSVLHERFANWLEADSTEPELDELVGYHLEQAYRNREALGPVDEHAKALAERAGELLGRAGRRAYERDDVPAAVKLLDRALALVTGQTPARLELIRQLTSALWSIGEVARAEALLNGLIEMAGAIGDRRYELYGEIQRASRRTLRDPHATWDDTETVAQQAIPLFEELGDDLGLAQAWLLLGMAYGHSSRITDSLDAAERALHHARRGGASREEFRAVDGLCAALRDGPTPVAEAIARVDQMLRDAAGKRPLEANLVSTLAELRAMNGEFDDARRLYREAQAIYSELGLRFAYAGLTEVAGVVELLAGDAFAAERVLREGYEIVADVPTWRTYHLTLLGEALYAQRRFDEARLLLEAAEPPAANSRLDTHISWQTLRAKLLVQANDPEAATALARDAVARATETDEASIQGQAHAALAEVLAAIGSSEAPQAARRAADVFRQKGNIVAAERMDALLSTPVTR
jgi:tetratricopeptide (TPR) repeat protein